MALEVVGVEVAADAVEGADVEVEVKMIIANAEKHRRLGEEDVFEGNPDNLKDFIDQQIYRFTQLYVEGRGW